MANIKQLKIEMVRVEQRERRTVDGTNEDFLRATFNIGAFGPYWVDVPTDTESEELVGLVEERAKAIQKVLLLTE